MLKAIYVEQFGGWWKLTPAEWHKLLEGGARGRGHTLPAHGQLKRKPGFVRSDRDRGPDGRSYHYTSREDVWIVQPLDWFEEDYAEALKELEEKEKL